MDVIPAIDIRGGRCVRLAQGDYDRETVFSEDPVAMAVHWVEQGARRLHVVDLDAAREGGPRNQALIERIVREAGVPVQVAGGVRDLETVGRWLGAGAQRVVLGTVAARDPSIVEQAVAAHGDGVAVSVDARNGIVAVQGWTETTELRADDLIRRMAQTGVRHFIFTDISRDGMMEHPDFELVPPLVAVLAEERTFAAGDPAPLIYGGGITSVEDILELSRYEIEGVITGRALYDGRVNLREAQRALAVGDDW